MPSLEKLLEISEGKNFDSEQGFIAKYGKTQESILKNFNVGVARFFGLPRLAVDLLEAAENKVDSLVGLRPVKSSDGGFLPSTGDIQNYGAKLGITYPESEEPQDLNSRIIQNIGTTGPLLPLLGTAAIFPELLSATTAAIGGKITESTDFGKRHPDLARAIGELGGGFSPTSAKLLFNYFKKGGFVGTIIRNRKNIYKEGKSLFPSTQERVAKRIKSITPLPKQAEINIIRESRSPEGKILMPSQASEDVGLARLSRTVEAEVPEFAEEMAKKRISQFKFLEKQFKGTGKVEDARAFIEADLTQRANLANIALSKIDSVKDPADLSVAVENISRGGLKTARDAETRIWKAIPDPPEFVEGENLVTNYIKHVEDITEGGTFEEISTFVKSKLGDPVISKKTGKFRFKKPGELFNKKKPEASAKAVYQFYQHLGREADILSRQAGTANKLRIIGELRDAAMQDLIDAGLSKPYLDAIDFSRDLNEKFTRGGVGKILGFARGEPPSPTSALNVLIGKGGQSGKEAIQQVLRGTPEAQANIEEFIKTQFAIFAKDTKSNLINVNSGNRFLKNYDEILTDVFPSLKDELKNAIVKQMDVDQIAGVPQTSQLSPLIREKTAVSIFLKANPNEEMASILNSGSFQRIKVLTDLVDLSKKDNTGRALAGLQNGFLEEIFNYAKTKDGIDGKLMLNKISKLKPDILKSGLFDKDEIKRLNRIGDVYEKIFFELKKSPFPEGIIDDLPSYFQTNLLKIIAVRSIGYIKSKLKIGSSFGTSLQEAQLASGAAARFSKSLTNDDARNFLISAVKDRDIMKDMLKNIPDMPISQKEKFFAYFSEKYKHLKAVTPSQVLSKTAKRAVKKLDLDKPRAGTLIPASASLGESLEEEKDRQVTPEQISELRNLKSLIRR